MKEIWELVNADGEPSGVLRDRASGEPYPEDLYFKVVEVWVRVKDRILLTQRHPKKWAGLKWEASGGGVTLGERDVESAVRELYEETGISARECELFYLGRSVHHPAMVESFLLTLDDLPKLSLQPSEVVGARLITRAELIVMKDELTLDTYKRFRKYEQYLFG